MPRIENEVAVVEVKTLAAEITSFYDKEKNIEHMWQGDPQFWAGRNPILFPMVGSTWTKDYQIDGIDEEFAPLVSPLLSTALLNGRLSKHFEANTGHDLDMRRYYRQFDY